VIQQILKQLYKLIDVVMVQDLKASESISLEMALIKVLNKSEVISKIEKNYSSLEFNELDNKDEKTILRLIGDTDNLESLLVELEDDLIEVTRTGALGMTLGNVSLETEEETKVIY
jgi:acetolactate synthase-1/3 small subunit